MVKVSVIIPVHNVEKYLVECLDSVVNQTLKDIEIICVNDGSTDKSLDILNDYALNEKRLKVISQKNAGRGVASNLGMNIASGDYLYFMDSDDIIKSSALEELYNYIKLKDADFIIFQAINYDSDKNIYYETKFYSMNDVSEFIGDSVVDYRDLDNLIFSISVPPWNKLFNHDFLKENNIKFVEGLIFEDNIFFWDVLFNAKNIGFYSKYFYIRRRHSSSVMSSQDQRYIDSIKINNLMIGRFKKYGVFNKFKKILYNRKVNLTYNRFCEINPNFENFYFLKLKEDYDNIVSEGLYDDYVNLLDVRNKSIFDFCLNSNTSDEFKFKMAYWDSQQSCKKQEKQIKNLQKTIEKNKMEIKNLTEKNYSLKGKNTLLKNNVNYYNSSVSWKVTRPLRNLNKLLSNDVLQGKGTIEFKLSKAYFVEDEVIKISNVILMDKKHKNICIDLNRFNVIYDEKFMIPFKDAIKSTNNCYEFPAVLFGVGFHQISLNYGKLFSEKLSVFIKDKDNLFDYNVWSGSDYNKDISGFDKFNVKSIKSTNEWSDIGEKSIEVYCDGSSNYQALLTPSQKVNMGDFVFASVSIYNPDNEVIVRLFESDISSYVDINVPASNNPKNIKITKFAKSNKIQLLIISKVKQKYYADNFVIKIN